MGKDNNRHRFLKLKGQAPAFDWNTLTPVSIHHPKDLIREYWSYYGLDMVTAFNVPTRYTCGLVDTGKYLVMQHAFMVTKPRGSAIIHHGYTDHSALLQPLIQALVNQNYCVLAYDLPGHGFSSGVQAGIDHFDDYRHTLESIITQANEHLPQPWHVLGHSTGASICLDFLLNREHNHTHHITSLLLLAPLVRPYHWTAIRTLLILLNPWCQRIPHRGKINSSDAAFTQLLANDPLKPKAVVFNWLNALNHWQTWLLKQSKSSISIPTYMLQGDRDNTVDWIFGNQHIRRLCNHYVCEYLHGASHHLVNEAPVLRESALSKITRFLESATHD